MHLIPYKYYQETSNKKWILGIKILSGVWTITTNLVFFALNNFPNAGQLSQMLWLLLDLCFFGENVKACKNGETHHFKNWRPYLGTTGANQVCNFSTHIEDYEQAYKSEDVIKTPVDEVSEFYNGAFWSIAHIYWLSCSAGQLTIWESHVLPGLRSLKKQAKYALNNQF